MSMLVMNNTILPSNCLKLVNETFVNTRNLSMISEAEFPIHDLINLNY